MSYCHPTEEDLAIMRRMPMHTLGEYIDADTRDFLIMHYRGRGKSCEWIEARIENIRNKPKWIA